ncbi:MAG: hypothetical protein J2P22_04075 [Nocardioides sp.]|nr:hypothetical protein [Nocardioides sp.]
MSEMQPEPPADPHRPDPQPADPGDMAATAADLDPDDAGDGLPADHCPGGPNCWCANHSDEPELTADDWNYLALFAPEFFDVREQLSPEDAENYRKLFGPDA